MVAADRYAFAYALLLWYEDTGYVAVRLDFVEFASLDERREHCPVLGASVVACEKRVFAL